MFNDRGVGVVNHDEVAFIYTRLYGRLKAAGYDFNRILETNSLDGYLSDEDAVTLYQLNRVLAKFSNRFAVDILYKFGVNSNIIIPEHVIKQEYEWEFKLVGENTLLVLVDDDFIRDMITGYEFKDKFVISITRYMHKYLSIKEVAMKPFYIDYLNALVRNNQN